MAQSFNLGALGQFVSVDTAGNNITISANSVTIGNSSTGIILGSNSSAAFTGTANNSLYLGGTAAASYALLSGASFTGTVNATAHTIGTTWVANASGVYMSMPLTANGGTGTAGQLLYSNGAIGAPYWAAAPANYTISTGLINTTGTITVNAAYIATISANNASYLGGTAAASYALTSALASYQTTAGLSANVATLTANNASYLGGTIASSFVANASYGLLQNTSGQFVVAGTGTVVNATGVHVNATYIGTISANNASYLGGTAAASYALLASPTFTGTTTGNALNVTTQTNTATLYVTTSANVGTYFTVNSTSAVKAVNASFTGANLSISGTNTYITSNTLITGTLTSAANVILNNNINIIYKTISGANVSFVQQNDDNFVFYSTNTAGGQRAVYSIFANSITSNLNFAVRTAFNGGVIIPTGQTFLDSTGSQGTVGQVLTSNGTGNVYWSTVSSGASYTFSTGLTNTANTITVNSAYIATISANNASYLGGTAAASYALLASPTFTGTTTLSNLTTTGSINVSGNSITNYTEFANAFINSGSAQTISSNTNVVRYTLTANCVLTLPLGSAVTVTNSLRNIVVFVKQDATGGRTLSFANQAGDTILYNNSLTFPSPNTTANKVTIYTCQRYDGDTNWYISMSFIGA